MLGITPAFELYFQPSFYFCLPFLNFKTNSKFFRTHCVARPGPELGTPSASAFAVAEITGFHQHAYLMSSFPMCNRMVSSALAFFLPSPTTFYTYSLIVVNTCMFVDLQNIDEEKLHLLNESSYTLPLLFPSYPLSFCFCEVPLRQLFGAYFT